MLAMSAKPALGARPSRTPCCTSPLRGLLQRTGPSDLASSTRDPAPRIVSRRTRHSDVRAVDRALREAGNEKALAHAAGLALLNRLIPLDPPEEILVGLGVHQAARV